MGAMEQPAGRKRDSASAWAGELIVQNGRQSGARKHLQVPTTFLGQAPHCDVRLNVDGVSAMHCMLVHGPSGLVIRDLASASGTFLNGARVTQANLKDGDLLTVGPFQFRLHLPPASFAIPDRPLDESNHELAPAERDALRLQAAAVAAQQAALGEEEVRLLQRKTALEKQEEQLGSHLEEKRRKLIQLAERAQAERTALEQDRLAYEQQLDKIAEATTQGQRELQKKQEKLEAGRRKLGEIYRGLRRRVQRQEQLDKARIQRLDDGLAQRARGLDLEKSRLAKRAEDLEKLRREVQEQYESGQKQLQQGRHDLRQSQQQWRERRSKELTILRQRSSDLQSREKSLAHAQGALLKDKQKWQVRRETLTREAQGLESRIKNQRQKLLRHQLDTNRLENLTRNRPQPGTALVPVDRPYPVAGDQAEMLAPDRTSDPAPRSSALTTIPDAGSSSEATTDAALTPGFAHLVYQEGNAPLGPGVPCGLWTDTLAKQEARLQEFESELNRRQEELERLTGDLSDQRLQVVQQWQCFAQTQKQWQEQHDQAAGDLENLALRLQEQEEALNQRLFAFDRTDAQLRIRHRELTHLRQHLIAWRAQLRIRENSLESERELLLTEVQTREALADKHLAGLVELRQRWAKRRRKEVDHIKAERAAVHQLRQECTALRQDLAQHVAKLDEDKRRLTGKSLALEQFRQETLARMDHPDAERRLEHLRQRWLVQHSNIVSATIKQRETLQSELATLESQLSELQKRQEMIEKAENELTDRQTSFEHKQALAATRHARLEQELQDAQSLRLLMEEQIARMKEEVERIARNVLDEPDAPAEALDQAA